MFYDSKLFGFFVFVFLVVCLLFLSFLFALNKNVDHFACVVPLVRQVTEYCNITGQSSVRLVIITG